ncbi:hypothetical protein AX761_19445 [Rhizobium sp. 58]|nr:hypothetical protein AX761_19445 [Rhizobium sp. 58]
MKTRAAVLRSIRFEMKGHADFQPPLAVTAFGDAAIVGDRHESIKNSMEGTSALFGFVIRGASPIAPALANGGFV